MSASVYECIPFMWPYNALPFLVRRVVRSQSAVCRLFAQVDFRREMRPIAFVDPGAFTSTYSEMASIWQPKLLTALRHFARRFSSCSTTLSRLG